jgi:hypothetical protein
MTQTTETTELGFETPIADSNAITTNWTGQKRPTKQHPEVVNTAIEYQIDKFQQWTIDSPKEEIKKDLQDALKYLRGGDGYKIAKSLDSDGWMSNSALVEICDDLITSMYSAENKHIKKWVKDNKLTLPLNIGDSVKIVYRQYKDVSGIVKEKHENTHKYLIFCESLGHVTEGSGTHGMYIIPENIIQKT